MSFCFFRRFVVLERRLASTSKTTQNVNTKTAAKAVEESSSSKKGKKADEEEWKSHVNPQTGEVGGPQGYEPTKFGDWAKAGRVSDF